MREQKDEGRQEDWLPSNQSKCIKIWSKRASAYCEVFVSVHRILSDPDDE